MVNVSWRRSTYDDQVHAFPVAQVAEPRSFLVAICSHSARPAALEPAGYRGHWSALLDASTCLGCLAIVGDQLADAGRLAGGTAATYTRPAVGVLPPSPAAGRLHVPGQNWETSL